MSNRERVAALWNGDLSAPQIAKRLGISHQRVRQLVAELGLESPKHVLARRQWLKREIRAAQIIEAQSARAVAKAEREKWLFDGAMRGLSPDVCWPWGGSSKGKGYGDFRGKYAHRVAWERANGRPIPSGLWVLHHCDNPPCVNPAHLFLGTNRDNVHDSISKGRWQRAHPTIYPDFTTQADG